MILQSKLSRQDNKVEIEICVLDIQFVDICVVSERTEKLGKVLIGIEEGGSVVEDRIKMGDQERCNNW